MPELDLLSLLRDEPPDVGVFGANRSADARWVTDGTALFVVEEAFDEGLVRRLARAGKADRRWAAAARIEGILRYAEGNARWQVRPRAAWARGGSRFVRWALSDGRPVADCAVEVLRLADACVGGWDEVTWSGEVQFGPLTLWRRGRVTCVLAPERHRTGPSIPPLGPEELLAGSDPPLPPPPWRPGDPWLNRPYGLEAVCLELGGVPDGRRGLPWAVPTRGGLLRVGEKLHSPKDEDVVAFFDDPLAAARVVEANLMQPLERPIIFRSFGDFWQFVRRHQLAVAPEHRVVVGSPPPLLGPRYDVRVAPGTALFALWDDDEGAALRGRFSLGERDRAAALAGRLNAARRLARAVGVPEVR